MINVAVLGFGTVGCGVVEVITKNSNMITENAGSGITVKYIVDIRDFPDSIYRNLFVKDFSVVENDPEVNVVVETIGGVGVAYEFTKRSLLAGKNVVTSNKELVATHGCELLSIAKEKNVNYLFEASVGGGIPILRPLTQCLAANRIEEIYGIFNGTTNYILTAMLVSGTTFDCALKEAQRLGYAEANPTADIEGMDTCRKVSIIGSLGFGKYISPDSIKTEGIRGITLDDMRLANAAGYSIKLLGRAILGPDGKATAFVAPHLVRNDSLISGTDGVMNAITVRGNAVGEVMFYGPGAGSLPTASAVVADIIDIAGHIEKRKNIGWSTGDPDFVADADAFVSDWYVRTSLHPNEVLEVFPDAEFIGTGEDTAFITKNYSAEAIASGLESLSALSAFRVLS